MSKLNILRNSASLALIFLMSAGLVAAEDVIELYFEKIPEIISSRNLNIKANQKMVEAAQSQTGYLKRSFYPKAEILAGYESFETGPFSRKDQPYGQAEVVSSLYRGGRDQSEDKLRETHRSLAEAKSERAYRESLNLSRKFYWDLVHAREMIGLFERALKKNNSIKAMAVRRIQSGLASETDRLEFDMVEARLQESLHSYEHELILIEASLAPYLGYPVGARFKTPDVVPIVDIEIFQGNNKTNPTPDLLMIQAQEAEAKVKTTMNRSWWKPSLDVYGGYYLYTFREREYVDRDDRKDLAVGGRLSMFLFEGGQSMRESQSFTQQADAYREQGNFQQKQNEAEYFRSVEDLKHELDLIQSSQNQIKLVNQYLDATLNEYKRGIKNSPDVVGALEKRYAMETEYAKRRRNAQLIKSDILRLRGE